MKFLIRGNKKSFLILLYEISLVLQNSPGFNEQLIPNDPLRLEVFLDACHEIWTKYCWRVRMSVQFDLMLFGEVLEVGWNDTTALQVDLKRQKIIFVFFVFKAKTFLLFLFRYSRIFELFRGLSASANDS